MSIIHQMTYSLPNGSRLPASQSIVSCDACGFCHADSSASEADYEAHYSANSKYESDDSSISTGGASKGEEARFLSVWQRIKAAGVADNASLLDFGCAGGGLLSFLKSKGMSNLSGADASAGCVAKLPKMGMHGFVATFSSVVAATAGQKFDCIILSHVLEHSFDPAGSIKTIASLLSESGVLYVETPDAEEYENANFPAFYFFDHEHIRHFSICHLEALCNGNGLRPLSSGKTTLRLEGGQPYPACWVALQKTADPRVIRHGKERFKARERLYAYAMESKNAAGTKAFLDAALFGKDPIILWGCGAWAMRTLSGIPMEGSKIIAIADSDKGKQGTLFFGIPVADPETAIKSAPAGAVVACARALGCDEMKAFVTKTRPDLRAFSIHEFPEQKEL